MQFSPLSLVKHRVAVGTPLPFNVRNADTTLLLARGQVVKDLAQLEALFQRGALVDLAELTTGEVIGLAQPRELPRLWKRCMAQLADSLRQPEPDSFATALDSATVPVLALIERDRDLAIFQVLRQDTSEHVQYGVNHSLHAAICSYLVAQRLGWAAADALRAFKVALTMNVSMLELQGQLAVQTAAPTAEQRAAIQAHPTFSRQILELSGVSDAEWLKAVEQHHEHADGSGYPSGLRAPCDTAALVHRADVYTAKLSPRAGREAIAADKAGRMMFMQDAGHPMTAALVKEFGVYPPGCWVRMANGESGIVVRRGPTVTTPVVAAMTAANGAVLPGPVRRDTSQATYAVHSVLGLQPPGAKVKPEQLMELLAG